MEPFSMALLLGSTALKVGGELYKGFAGSRAGRLQAQLHESNARWLTTQSELAHAEAGIELQRGAFDATRFLRAGERTASGQTAYFGAGGIDPRYGSPLVLAGTTIAQSSVDAALAVARGAGAAATAEGRSAQAAGQAAGQAGAALGAAERGDAAMISGIFGAGAALLGGATAAWGNLSAKAPVANSGGGFTITADDVLAPQRVPQRSAWDLY